MGLLLFARKKLADSYLQTHLAFSQRVLAQAENQYAKGDHRGALDKLEKLLLQNPTLAFGESNDHPALELLGIDFVPRQVKDEPVKTISEKKAIEDPEAVEEAPGARDQATGEARGVGAEARGNSEESEKIKDADASPEPRAPSTEEAPSPGPPTPSTDTDPGPRAPSTEESKLNPEEEEELRRAEALALLKKSSFYEKSGQRQKALACIERSIKLDRGRAEAWIQLGNLSSKVGGNWDTIRGYYDWVVDLKLRMIQNWVSHEDVPPQYLLWFMEELSVLKRNLHALGRAMKTLRGARDQGPGSRRGARRGF
jgi:tetratricopeptide (TPR) repeat protein